MKKYRQKIGQLGERIAEKFLKEKGYKIIDKNIHSRYGEIDILAKIKQKYVFFEIKARTSLSCGYPEEAINYQKLAKISRTINNYLIKHYKITDWQADCLSIKLDLSDKSAKIYHLKDLDFSDLE